MIWDSEHENKFFKISAFPIESFKTGVTVASEQRGIFSSIVCSSYLNKSMFCYIHYIYRAFDFSRCHRFNINLRNQKMNLIDRTSVKNVLFPKRSFSQCAEWILNKISKPLNETFIGFKCMIQGFRICFVWNPRLKGIESTC